MKTKTIAMTLMFVLCLGLVTAINVYNINPSSLSKAQSNGYESGMGNPQQGQSFSSGSSTSSTSSSSKKSGGALLTRLIWNGEECVKAPVLSRSYRSGPNSRMIVPHIVVKENEDGSKIIKRIFDSKYTLAWDADKRRIDKSGTCDVNEQPQFLEIDWWKYYHTKNYKEVI